MTTFLTSHQIAERYGVTKRTLQRWKASPPPGFPRPIQIGKRLLWSAEQVATYEAMKQNANA
jgi:predicted DNA-binding transcriptional regulator AlpA